MPATENIAPEICARMLLRSALQTYTFPFTRSCRVFLHHGRTFISLLPSLAGSLPRHFGKIDKP